MYCISVIQLFGYHAYKPMSSQWLFPLLLYLRAPSRYLRSLPCTV